VNPTMRKPQEGLEAQTRQTLENIKAILEAGGSSLDRVVKITVFMSNIKDFAKMHEIYRSCFPTNPPARASRSRA
jgi:2-iminobutanoate/2-iminopropanoate deaminase